MKLSKAQWWLSLSVAILVGGILAFTPSILGNVVLISTSSTNVSTNTTVVVDVQITNAVNVSGAQFGVRYDENVLDFVKVEEGTFLSQGGAQTLFPNTTNKTSGHIDNIIVVRMGSSGANGSGTIARLTFTTQTAGTSAFSFSQLLLSDNNGNQVSMPNTTFTLTVYQATAPAINSTNLTAPTMSSLSAQSVSSSRATLRLTTNQSADCRYSTSDIAYSSMNAFSSTGSTTHTHELSSLSASTQYRYYARCRSGNATTNVSASVSFITTAATTSSGSGGSGGGGSRPPSTPTTSTPPPTTTPTTPTTQVPIVTVQTTADGISASLSVQTTYSSPLVEILAEGADQIEPDAAPLDTKAYSQFAIRYYGFTAAETRSATVTFPIDKTWLSTYDADVNTVKFYHLTSQGWQPVPATPTTETDTHYTYSATIPEAGTYLAGIDYIEPVVIEDPITNPEVAEPDNAQPYPTYMWIVLLGITVVAILGGFAYYRMHTKAKYEQAEAEAKEEALITYIKQMREQGYTDGNIADALRQAGWSAENIEHALSTHA